MRLAEPITPPISNRLSWPATFLGVMAIFTVALVAYFPALQGGQLWDDSAHITPQSLQDGQGLWQIWFQVGATQQYYPILHSAFWLEHQLWGDAVLGYHLVNVGLHAASACLFAAVLVRIRPADLTANTYWRTEWLAAAVFALHPVCVESVAWISEQKNTLSLVFYLLAALAYLRFDEGRKAGWYCTAFGFFLLALLSKSVTATLPAALLLVHYWRRGCLSWQRDVFPLVPWFVVGIGAGLFTAWVEHTYIGARGSAFELTLLQRCFLAGRAVWFYLGKLIWPVDLAFIYPRWQVATTWLWAIGAVAMVVGLGLLWRLRHRSRAPLVTALFFAGSLFPALGFFNVYPFVFSYVADHWQYLPSLGIIAMATDGTAWMLQRRIEKMPAKKKRGAVRLCLAGAGVVLMLLFGRTWLQAGVYRDVETLYTDTLSKNPDCWMAHNNLGLHLMERGDLPASMVHLHEAIRLKPDFPDAYNNLGNALSKIPGRLPESIPWFEQALRYNPGMAEAHGNLGWALVNAPGRLVEGIAHLRLALQLRPDFFRVHNSLGIALAKSPGQLEEAIAEFEKALQNDPDYAAARLGLGDALVTAGRLPEGIAQLELASKLTGDEPKMIYSLGTAFARAGRLEDAVTAFERSLKLQPDSPDTQNNLGNTLIQLGREDEAIGHYRIALKLAPQLAEVHFNLGRALRSKGDGSEAIGHYREALRLAPDSAAIWDSLGSLFYRWEKPEEAAAAYREAIRLQPDSALFHNNLGIALLEPGWLDEAMAQLHEALRLDPDYADARYNLGVALHQAGRLDEAAAAFKASGRQP